MDKICTQRSILMNLDKDERKYRYIFYQLEYIIISIIGNNKIK
jgi:hypothetical protein